MAKNTTTTETIQKKTLKVIMKLFSSNLSYFCGAVLTIISPSIDIQLQKNAKKEKQEKYFTKSGMFCNFIPVCLNGILC